jgi:hypothetical protein
MKLRNIALVLAVTLLSAAAHAQSGVYLTFDAQQFTQEGVLANPGTHGNIDRPWLYGPGYGIYYDVTHLPYIGKLKTGPVVFGIDGRGETLRLSAYGSEFARQDGIFSIRVSTKDKVKSVTPYFQGGFGIGHTKVPFRTSFSNNFIYQFSLGVDKKIHNKIDWRIVEASAGTLADYNTGYYPAGVGPGQSNYMITFATGLVFRIK